MSHAKRRTDRHYYCLIRIVFCSLSAGKHIDAQSVMGDSWPWRWRQQGPPKRGDTSTGLHGSATHKTVIFANKQLSVVSFILRMDSDSFLKHHQTLIDFCNRHVVCYVWNRNSYFDIIEMNVMIQTLVYVEIFIRGVYLRMSFDFECVNLVSLKCLGVGV